MNKNAWDILFHYFDDEKRLKIKALSSMVRAGLSKVEAASNMGISTGTAYKLLRYGMNSLTNSDKAGIKERDKYTCRQCGIRATKGDGKLHVHHEGNPKNNHANNLVTLCASCHKKLSAKGKKALRKKYSV